MTTVGVISSADREYFKIGEVLVLKTCIVRSDKIVSCHILGCEVDLNEQNNPIIQARGPGLKICPCKFAVFPIRLAELCPLFVGHCI